MDVKNTVHSAFDKRRIRFADWLVQYSVGFTLILVAMLVASGYLVERYYSERVAKLTALQEVSVVSLELVHAWQTTDFDATQARRQISSLLQQEQQLLQHLRAVSEKIDGLPTAPVAIAQFTPQEQVQLALNRLQQVGQVAAEKRLIMSQRGVLESAYLWPLLIGWALLFVYTVWGWRRTLVDQREALQFFHSQVDKAQGGVEHLPVPIMRNDEFGDFARYLDSMLSSMLQDKAEQQALAQAYKAALASSLSYKLLLNEEREVLVVSEGLSELWVLEPSALAQILGVDEHLDDLHEEVVNADVLEVNLNNRYRVGKRLYELRCTPVAGHHAGYLVELVPQDAYNELKVLETTVSLMANDVWDAPIRLLDTSSPYTAFSSKLEQVRLQVVKFMSTLQPAIDNLDKPYPKITKLQQLSQVLLATLSQSETSDAQTAWLSDRLASEVDVSRQDFLQVREQIEQRFELYEAYLQQLVERQAAQSTWVATVSEGLLDTKQAVLNLLSLVNGDQKSASEIEHSVIDLTHDIDTVLADILDAKPGMGELGVEHIKGSESDLMLRLNDVQTQFDRITDLVKSSAVESSRE
ncbi:hypothetical protein [Marinomonas ostreistagni]|uniref:hypothetical protein n=1 Tax=Marinomonas ostreistagni TaxID=359209 RepID=UPI00195054C5|nr:hypothetical protein [Marinomonas ostreistagni]MBM6551248.1 hypothetical protein [Marinomonas ostreistagni]